jgi:hypothetical protein
MNKNGFINYAFKLDFMKNYFSPNRKGNTQSPIVKGKHTIPKL